MSSRASSSADPLQRALRSARVTREVVVEHDALPHLPALAAAHASGRPLVVVADETTLRVAGDAVLRLLRAAGMAPMDPWVMPAVPRPKPLETSGRELAGHLERTGSVAIAAGSGVVNDLAKYASELAGRPYLSVPTAASMDGYAASGAALIADGFKRTLPCKPPVAIVADLDILAAAPRRMAGWGFGDLAGKIVAGADWLVAEAAGVEAIDRAVFDSVQQPLAYWLSMPQALAQGKPEAAGRLLSGLLVSGFAMQAHGNSRPASGSEHQFSHLWEMEGLSVGGEAAAHGACVGVGAVAMLAAYAWLIEQPIDADAVSAACATPAVPGADEQEVRAAFASPEIVESAMVEVQAKTPESHRRERLESLLARWPALRARLAQSLLPPSVLQEQLSAAGAASHPADLGVTLDALARDHRRARLIRRRYTVLDLLHDLGWLDRAIAALFGPGGFWRTALPPSCSATTNAAS